MRLSTIATAMRDMLKGTSSIMTSGCPGSMRLTTTGIRPGGVVSGWDFTGGGDHTTMDWGGIWASAIGITPAITTGIGGTIATTPDTVGTAGMGGDTEGMTGEEGLGKVVGAKITEAMLGKSVMGGIRVTEATGCSVVGCLVETTSTTVTNDLGGVNMSGPNTAVDTAAIQVPRVIIDLILGAPQAADVSVADT